MFGATTMFIKLWAKWKPHKFILRVLSEFQLISVISNHTIPIGTLFRFSNHSKIYMINSPKVANQYEIFPALRQSVTSTPFTWQDDVIMPVLIDLDAIIGMNYTDGVLMDNGEMTFVEDV